jgi:hypothetical protein
MNVAAVTKDTKIGDSLTRITPSAAYSVLDSIANKTAVCSDCKVTPGDFVKNSLGV